MVVGRCWGGDGYGGDGVVVKGEGKGTKIWI